jgi:hypothetical protein
MSQIKKNPTGSSRGGVRAVAGSMTGSAIRLTHDCPAAEAASSRAVDVEDR